MIHLYDNVPLYVAAIDFAGNTNLKIRLTALWEDEIVTGAFHSQDDEGILRDKLAADTTKKSGNKIEIEQEIFDFYHGT